MSEEKKEKKDCPSVHVFIKDGQVCDVHVCNGGVNETEDYIDKMGEEGYEPTDLLLGKDEFIAVVCWRKTDAEVYD